MAKRKKKVSRVLRSDGYIELPWYKRLKFLVTGANGGQGYDVILSGPSAAGKTVAGYMIAEDLGYECIVQQCHRRMETEDFRGTRSIKPGPKGMPITGFDPGPVLHAVQRAIHWRKLWQEMTEKDAPKGKNKNYRAYKGVVWLGDELNLVDPGMLAFLNNLLQRDKNSKIVVPETGKSYDRPPNLIILGTMNPEYAAANQLSEAMLSRVVLLECPAMQFEDVRDILAIRCPNNSMVRLVARTMGAIRAAHGQQEITWDPDLRTMQQLLDYWYALEPEWERTNAMARFKTCLDEIVGPKIGWYETFAHVRNGIWDAVCAMNPSEDVDEPDGKPKLLALSGDDMSGKNIEVEDGE
jgi:hypothetical protein